MKRTPERVERILEMVRNGVDPLPAASACGITIRTMYRWMESSQFVIDIEAAKREAVARFSLMMAKHSAKNWQACARMLESLDPARWTPVVKQLRDIDSLTLEEILDELAPAFEARARTRALRIESGGAA